MNPAVVGPVETSPSPTSQPSFAASTEIRPMSSDPRAEAGVTAVQTALAEG